MIRSEEKTHPALLVFATILFELRHLLSLIRLFVLKHRLFNYHQNHIPHEIKRKKVFQIAKTLKPSFVYDQKLSTNCTDKKIKEVHQFTNVQEKVHEYLTFVSSGILRAGRVFLFIS